MAPGMTEPLSPPTAADLWIRNLRLLDLDRLQDWPSRLTALSFKEDDIRTRKNRIRRAEWILYRLFELWDPRETQLSLAALFPALEPAQSIRLRSSMLTLMSTLKQDGHLGTCALRKSLLDECCGPRFDHLLLALSTAVLKRIAIAGSHRPSISLSRAVTNEIVDLQVLQQLALVHDLSIRKDLQFKDLFRVRAEGLEAYIHIKELTMQARDDLNQTILGRLEQDFDMSQLDSKGLKKKLRAAAGPDEAWMNLLLSGEPAKDRDAMPEDDFEALWTRTQQGSDFQTHASLPSGFLTSVEARLGQRQEQLKKWRRFQSQTTARNEDLIVARTPVESPRKTPSASSARRSPTKTFKRMNSIRERSGSSKVGSDAMPATAAERASNRLRDAVKADRSASTSATTPPLKRSNSLVKQDSLVREKSARESALESSSKGGLRRRSRSELSSYRPTPAELQDSVNRLGSGLNQLQITSNHYSLAERTRETLELTSRQPRQAQSSALCAADDVTTVIDSPLASKSGQRSLAERASVSLQGLDAGPKSASRPVRRATQRRTHERKNSQLAHTVFEPEGVPVQASPFDDGEQAPSLPLVAADEPKVAQQLVEETFDAESVFKTRARVRRSPPPSEG